MHKGMDFRAGYGTPILAAASGRVVRAGWAGGYGRQVRISHDGPYATSYSHMSRMIVSPGQHVRQGQVIGYVGNTGLSTGPHLHYEVLINGNFVDPMRIKLPRGRELDGKFLRGFERERARIDSIIERGAAMPRVAAN